MIIEKAEPTAEIEAFIESEQERYEAENNVFCSFTPYCFTARIGDEIVGVVKGAAFFSEVYIDELVVRNEYRRQGIGTALIRSAEDFCKDCGYGNINCCTNGFQASGFYEKCGFELEFVRKNKKDPKLDKYFYIKYFN